jgi:hypothetical protein
MNAVVKTDATALSAASLEHVLGTGDLSKLTTQQRVEYYGQVCRSIGINPLTRPFRFMSFQGQTVLYATRDCTDQLRNLRKINITIADKQLDGDLFIVTARATTADGRSDEDVGAVVMGKLIGDARANAIMKAMTKAKRRVTMSICGLGFLDESEVETLQGATTYDAEAEPPLVKLPHIEVYARRDEINKDVPIQPKRQTVSAWLDALRLRVAQCQTTEELDQIATGDEIAKAQKHLRNGALEELNAIMADAMARLQAPVTDTPVTDTVEPAEDDTFPGDRPLPS